MISDLWQLRYGLEGHGLGEERAGAGLLVLDSHAESGKCSGAAETTVFVQEDGNFVGVGGSLQNDGSQLAQGLDELGCERSNCFGALNLGVEGCGGLEF